MSPTFDHFLKPTMSMFSNDIGWRVNIMVARKIKLIPFFLTVYQLKPIYHFEYESHHKDKNLKFYAWKLCFLGRELIAWSQGTCGYSFLKEEAFLSDLRGESNQTLYHVNYSGNAPALIGHQDNKQLEASSFIQERTKNLLGILSIPIFEDHQDRPPEAKGVINFDTESIVNVDRFIDDADYRQKAFAHFSNFTNIVRYWV